MNNNIESKFNFYYFAGKTAYFSMVGGLLLGNFYHFGLIGDDGWWISAFAFIAKHLLDVPLTLSELVLGGLIAICGLGFRASFIYDTGRILLAKCILGLAPIPLMAVCASLFIPDFREMNAVCMFITIEAYTISIFMWYFLSDIKIPLEH